MARDDEKVCLVSCLAGDDGPVGFPKVRHQTTKHGSTYRHATTNGTIELSELFDSLELFGNLRRVRD